MSDYVVGVDLGTTYSAAAVLWDGRLEVVELGERIASVASVLWFRDDGRIVVGEAAVRRAEVEPGRMAREFKRRFGEPIRGDQQPLGCLVRRRGYQLQRPIFGLAQCGAGRGEQPGDGYDGLAQLAHPGVAAVARGDPGG